MERMPLPIREGHPHSLLSVPGLWLTTSASVGSGLGDSGLSPRDGRVRASKQSFLVACHPQSEDMVSGLLLLAVPSLPVPFELLTRLCLVISSS